MKVQPGAPAPPFKAWRVVVDGDVFIMAARTEEGLRAGLLNEGVLTGGAAGLVQYRPCTDEELDAPLRVTGEDGSPRGKGSYETTLRHELEMVTDMLPGVEDGYILAEPLYWR
jgi:hypothetical protein